MKKLRFVHIVPLLLVFAFAGCTGFLRTLTDVIAGVEVAQSELAPVRIAIRSYFTDHPNPSLEAKVTSALAATDHALTVAVQIARGVEGSTTGHTGDAFAAFLVAYRELWTILNEAGVLSARGVFKASPVSHDGIEMPLPEELLGSMRGSRMVSLNNGTMQQPL